MALNANAAPSENFDLSDWKLTLPLDASGKNSGTAVEVKSLSAYERTPYFYTGSDGAMVFAAPVGGATTSGSSYARSELREMLGADRAAWSLAQGGFMAATLEVDRAPVKFDGVAGRIVVGQIHGVDDELVRLYWENGKVYFVNDQAGSRNSETKFFFVNSAGEQPAVSLDERFYYSIDARGDNLVVKVVADGQTYTSATRINDVWDTDKFYFKAGAYLNVNETQGTGWGQASFYSLTFNHDTVASQPPPPPPAVDPSPPSSLTWPVTTKTIDGSEGDNYVKGTSGNDLLRGNGGDDVLWGYVGSDVLIGGVEKDTFAFTTAIGQDVDVIVDFDPTDDTIRLENAIFAKLTKTGALSGEFFQAGSSARDANDHVVYDQLSGGLFYDADGSGSGAAVLFAVLENKTLLTASDFSVI